MDTAVKLIKQATDDDLPTGAPFEVLHQNYTVMDAFVSI